MSIADFIEDYFEIHPGERLVLHDYQRDLLESDAIMRIVLKSRQVGISSVMAWEALAHCLLEPNLTVLFVSASHRQAKELLSYVKGILSNLRLRGKIPTSEETKQSIIFENHSRIVSLPTSPNTIQGIRAHRVYIDEYGIMDNDKEILEAILPSISHGGYVTIFSRPRGQRGEFHRLVQEARRGENDFVLFEIDYKRCKHKKFQEMIARIKKAMDPVSFAESYQCEFIDETRTFFPYEIMIPCIDNEMITPKLGMKLIFGIDFGRKQNSTVITIIEERNDYCYVRQIKEFLGISYSTQLSYINRRIEDLQPEEVRVDEYGVGVRLFEELREKHGNVIVPISFSNLNKNDMITNLRILFEDKRIRIPKDEKLLQQLHALQRKSVTGRVRWEPGKTDKYGKHDDYVWSLAMAVTQKRAPQIQYFRMGETKEAPMFKTQSRIGMDDDDEL